MVTLRVATLKLPFPRFVRVGPCPVAPAPGHPPAFRRFRLAGVGFLCPRNVTLRTLAVRAPLSWACAGSQKSDARHLAPYVVKIS